MDFSPDPVAEQLRAELRAFLDEHLGAELVDAMRESGVAHDSDFARALGERGWILPDPADDGAVLTGPNAQQVLHDEFARREAPTHGIGTSRMVARVILAVGSDELKAEIVPRVRRGEIVIALGMSEPGAGSDVAAAATRARRDGDDWIIDGQKMFTTNGHLADYVFLLARTNSEVPRHRGLTTFLVPVDHPGFEAQAVHTMSGERTNITFYTEVHLDDRWRIGDVDGGWNALMLSLQDEHSVGSSAHLDRLLTHAESWARTPDAGGAAPIEREDVRQRLARWSTRLEISRLLESRSVWMETRGDVPVAEGPMAKLFSTEALVAAAEDITEMIGPDGLRSRGDATALEDGHLEHALRFSLGTTIYAGTSEIQRNIIAQRACGLPRS